MGVLDQSKHSPPDPRVSAMYLSFLHPLDAPSQVEVPSHAGQGSPDAPCDWQAAFVTAYATLRRCLVNPLTFVYGLGCMLYFLSLISFPPCFRRNTLVRRKHLYTSYKDEDLENWLMRMWGCISR